MISRSYCMISRRAPQALLLCHPFLSVQVRPAFISSESFMKLHLQYHHVGVARFPNVAALQCCDANYARHASSNRQALVASGSFTRGTPRQTGKPW